ncbi:MAG: hypothetical protein NC417_00640 [Candidatus Gastranaerophilales bacterium]|nr:hypothetical protein [Candidatus Gastranaerophilales bacterium]
MRGLIKNAWLGWNRYMDAGKFAALLFSVILFLVLWNKIGADGKNRKKRLILEREAQDSLTYATFTAAACVFPLTAAVLMLYQTRFYDYEWIWNLVPTTAIIALGGTIFLDKIWEDYLGQKKKWEPFVVTGVFFAIIFFCGNLGQGSWSDGVDREERTRIVHILELLQEERGQQELCLWAPREVMECAGFYAEDICLLYGRDMWDGALGAYTYDVYDETRQELYRRMSQAEETGSLQSASDGLSCIKEALNLGVNCILLPDGMKPEELEEISRELQVEVVDWNGYVWLKIT